MTKVVMRRTRLAPYVPPVGNFERLRPRIPNNTPIDYPQASVHGPGYSFNSNTGDNDGRAVSTFVPVPVTTVTFVDTGNATTNSANIYTQLKSYTTGGSKITSNLRLIIPDGTLFAGKDNGLGTVSTVFPAGLINGVDPRIEICFASFASLPEPSSGDGSTKSSYLNQIPASMWSILPKFYQSDNEGGAITFEDGAANYTFRGIGISRPLNFKEDSGLIQCCAFGTYSAMTGWHPGWENGDPTKAPVSIHFIQCIIDGGTNTNNFYARKGMVAAGYGIAFVDGIVRNISTAGLEGQCLGTPAGPGPTEWFNNDLSLDGAGEVIFSGGSGLPADNPDVIPRDVAIVQNVIRCLPGAAGKGTVEVKFGERFLISGNRIIPADNTGGGHSGGIELKLTNQFEHGANARQSNIIVNNNYIPSGIGGIVDSGIEFSFELTVQPYNHFFGNNVLIAQVISGPREGSGLVFGGSGVHDVVAIFNTIKGDINKNYGNGIAITEPVSGDNFEVRWNVTIHTDNPPDPGAPGSSLKAYDAFSATIGEPLWDAWATGTSSYSDNLIWEIPFYSPLYIRQIKVGDIASMGLVDYATDQLSLLSSSPGYQFTDGWDVGYQKTLWDTIQARLNPV